MPHEPAHPPAIVRRAHAHVRRTALVAPEGTFSYADLLAASETVAGRLLRDRQDLDGARVAYLVAPGFRWAAVQWGVWRAGGIAVPLALHQPARELEHVLRDADVELVVCDADIADPALAAATEAGVHAADTSELLLPVDPRGVTALPDVPSERGAMILYTSGTTGRPKGVLSTHANLEAQIRAMVEAWRWRADDHVLLVLPLHHVHGIVNVLSSALWSGACCSVLPRFDAKAAWERIGDGDLTLFMAVPTIYQRMLDEWERADPDTRARWSRGARALRLCVSGSAALPVRVLERWEEVSGQRLLERYGMTEIGMALSNPLEGERKPGRVGSPMPGMEVRLVDEHGRVVPEGTPGEIQVRGPSVFREYWGRPAETHAAFAEGGWFRTGDLAVREHGSYRILGRASVDIVKTGGEKVSALEIEELLREHPGVSDCAVVGVPDAVWGERLCAAVVAAHTTAGASAAGDRTAAGAPDASGSASPPDAPVPPSAESLREWARERLAPWKVPKSVKLVEALPRNAMGKVDKAAVRALFR